MNEPDSKRTKRRDDTVENAIIELAKAQPELGQARVAEELARRGLAISASGVRHIWQRHDLETAYKRIKAIEATSGRRASRLTERQARLLERGNVGARNKRQSSKDPAIRKDGAVDRRTEILYAAAECFAKRGYGGTSLRDIAGVLGLLPGSIYHFFRTKEELFLSVHERGFVELVANVNAAMEVGTDPWSRLEAACREHIRALVAGSTILRLTGASFFSPHEPALAASLAADRRRYDLIFKGLVKHLDLPRTVDRTLFRLFVLGAINWAYVWYHDGKRTPEEIARQLILSLRHPGAARAVQAARGRIKD